MLKSINSLLNADVRSVATGEGRFYGCFLFSKGVIGADGER